MVTLLIIALLVATAYAIWYTGRKIAKAEATEAEADAATERVRALEKQNAAETQKRREDDVREANAATATPDAADGAAFLRKSWDRPN